MRYVPIAALGTLIAVALGVGLWHGLRKGRAASADAQRTASRWRDDQPVEYWPADDDDDELDAHAAVALSITCDWCRAGGAGRCFCILRCTDAMCEGRQTLTTWTEHDFTFAARHGFSLPERSEHQ